MEIGHRLEFRWNKKLSERLGFKFVIFKKNALQLYVVRYTGIGIRPYGYGLGVPTSWKVIAKGLVGANLGIKLSSTTALPRKEKLNIHSAIIYLSSAV